MASLAIASFIWLILRTGTKPSRITYPCQKAAAANVHIFLVVLFSPLISLKKFKVTLPNIFNFRLLKTVLLVGSLLLAPYILSLGEYVQANENYVRVPLDLKPQKATIQGASSNLFFIENASGAEGNMTEAITALFQLMENHGLYFFKTTSHPDGLIGKDDVIIIKVNCQWPQRGGTNTDLVKSLIQKIVNHPEGFTGEIVVADNGQGRGSLDWGFSNAYDHSQSMQDVVNIFPSYKVSTYLWDPLRTNKVNEYDQGDLNDGYVVSPIQDPETGLNVSYPKFRTQYGTYISFKRGIYAGTYDSEKLKVINIPVLKSHMYYGVTACLKHYMGVVSQDLTDAHYAVGAGAMGTEMAETRFPTLNIIDAIWVNANPKESGSPGPSTPYGAASFTDVIGASLDPVALEYWAAKHILIPAAINKGYTQYSSLDPDYEPVTPGLLESYHNYLERSMNELKSAGYQVTMNPAEMNVYVSPARMIRDVAVVSVKPLVAQVEGGKSVNITVTVRNEGALSELFNATETFNVTAYASSVFTGDTVVIGTKTVVNLVPKKNATLVFTWTTPLTSDMFKIKAIAEIIQGETDIADNTLEDGTITVTVGVTERNYFDRDTLPELPVLAMATTPNPTLPPQIYNTSIGGGIKWLSKAFPRRSESQPGNWTVRLYYTASKNTTIEVTISVHDANGTRLVFAQKLVELVVSNSPTPFDVIFVDPSINGSIQEWVFLSNRRVGVILNSTETYAIIYYDSVETPSHINLPTLLVLVGDISSLTPFVPDGKVDMADIGLVAKRFGVNKPNPLYNPMCDVTGEYPNVPDGKIDMRDIGLVASHFGDHL
jgi:hypothetical protein